MGMNNAYYTADSIGKGNAWDASVSRLPNGYRSKLSIGDHSKFYMRAAATVACFETNEMWWLCGPKTLHLSVYDSAAGIGIYR